MFQTVFLCGVVTLLCLTAVSLASYLLKLTKERRSRRLDLSPFFWAIGFLPVAIVTISNISFGTPALTTALTFLRNPLLTMDLTFGAFAQLEEISFLMDFITAILLTSTVVISLTRKDPTLNAPDARRVAKDSTCKGRAVSVLGVSQESDFTYIRFCRILS